MAEEKKKVTTKVKEVFEKNKTKIAVGVTAGVAFVAGAFAGKKYAEKCMARGLQRFTDKGIIRFFDITKEVPEPCDGERAIEVIKETFNT